MRVDRVKEIPSWNTMYSNQLLRAYFEFASCGKLGQIAQKFKCLLCFRWSRDWLLNGIINFSKVGLFFNDFIIFPTKDNCFPQIFYFN